MFSEKLKIVPVANKLDFNADAYIDCINMKNFHKATFVLTFHALAGNDGHLWLYGGAADATYTTPLPFKYAFGGAAVGSANCDKLAAWQNNPGTHAVPTALHITNGTYSNYMLVIEVDADEMNLTAGEFWLSIGILDTDGSATGTVTGYAILEPRYTGNRSDSALA
jgi:hypothetical protein